MSRNRCLPMVITDFNLFSICGKPGIPTFPSEDVEKTQEIYGFYTPFPYSIQGPLPISARTPSTVWRNSASTLIASSTLRIEWITVE